MSYIPIHVHTCWSLLDGIVDIGKLAAKAKEYELPAVCLTDHGNIKGVVTFVNQMEQRNIRPIIGCEINIRSGGRITLLAKNKTGYKNIVRITSLSHEPANLNENNEPTISLHDLAPFKKGLILLIGDILSPISYSIFTDVDEALQSNNLEIKNDWKAKLKQLMLSYKGFEHIFLFSDLDIDLPMSKILNECIVWLSNELNIPNLPSHNIHYLSKDDTNIHKLVLSSGIDSNKKLPNIYDHKDYRIFASSKSITHLTRSIDGGEKTLQLLDLIEDFSIKENPILPKFVINNNVITKPDRLLYDLCRKGFVTRNLVETLKTNTNLKDIYANRVKEELRTFADIGMSSYFLIVKDIIDFCKRYGIPVDVRGSSTGCLINYLLGVSSLDPLRPDPTKEYSPGAELSLERFYNRGRNTEDRVSLPDIDIDIPPHFRSKVIEYLIYKYGQDCVAHIITHTRFKGKGAVKEVFRLSDISNYYDISDHITKSMMDEAKISDELAEIQESDPSYGIIQWNIDNIASIREAYQEYSDIFDLAISLEKLPRNPSVHAAGLIIADRPLNTLFPMVWSPQLKSMVVAIEGGEVEQLGAVKLDLLGVSMLEKIFKIQEMIQMQNTETVIGLDNILEEVMF